MSEPQQIAWPVRTLRAPDGDLFISVDCLMNFRNMMGPAGWHSIFMQLLDHIITEARRADIYGRDVSP